MNGWSIPPLLMASINAFVAAQFFLVYLRTRRDREMLSFARLAFSVALYDVCCSLLYNASAPGEGRPWQLVQMGVLAVSSIALVAFVADYTRRPVRRFVAWLVAAYAVLGIAVVLGGANLIFTKVPAAKHIRLPMGLWVTYNEVAPGPLASGSDALALGVFVFVFVAAASQYRAGERPRAVRLLAATGLLFAAAVNDAALGLGLIRSVYLIEYAFLGVVILMASSLSGEVVEGLAAQSALHLSEERFRLMVQKSYDWIVLIDAAGQITYGTPGAAAGLGYEPGGLVGMNGFALIHPDDLTVARPAFERELGLQGTGVPAQFRARKADGSFIWVEAVANNLLDSPAVRGLVITLRDITERRRAEEEIRQKLREMTVLNAVTQVAVEAEDENTLISRSTDFIREVLFPDDCGILLVDETRQVLRYTAAYRASFGVADRPPIPLGTGITGIVATTGNAIRVDDVSAHPAYIARFPGMRSELCVPLKIGRRVIGVINAESGTASAFTPSDERILTTLAGQLATAIGRLRAAAAQRESEERFRRLAEAAFEGIGITDQGRIVDVNRRLAEMLGYEVSEMVGRPVMDFVAPESSPIVATFIREGKDELYEHLAIRKDGTVFPIETQGKPLSSGGGMRVAAVRDITERRAAESRIARQLERLAGLHRIDTTILEGPEATATIDVVLEQVLAQLHASAAGVLLLDAGSQTLTRAAGRGFRSPAALVATARLGECPAGRAAATRRLVSMQDLAAAPQVCGYASAESGERFRALYCAPLITKDHIYGVLEVFCSSTEGIDQEWLDYLETLAGQLAIAIDNRTLFESLQQTNAELARAYETTLEGWSRALEQRDRETQGHSARVEELTIQVARAMGVSEEDQVHLRRGALLHDIGKMGIPDTILLKPGPLSPEEWVVMRRHPQLAYELLAPITYLRPALDIPYCHHEWWDGSGYPRGLKGEEIPLAARIFAVVDTWDGLSFARPYRDAWPRQRVRAHIIEQAGTHFDPRVVETFLSVVGQDEA